MPGSRNANSLRPLERWTSAAARELARAARARGGVDAARDVLLLAAVVRAPRDDRPTAGTDHRRELVDLRRRPELEAAPDRARRRDDRGPDLTEDRIGDQQFAVGRERERGVVDAGVVERRARGRDRHRRRSACRCASAAPRATGTSRRGGTRPTPRRLARHVHTPTHASRRAAALPAPSARAGDRRHQRRRAAAAGPRASRTCRRPSASTRLGQPARELAAGHLSGSRCPATGADHGPTPEQPQPLWAWRWPWDAEPLRPPHPASTMTSGVQRMPPASPRLRRQPATQGGRGATPRPHLPSASRSSTGSGVGEKRPSRRR